MIELQEFSTKIMGLLNGMDISAPSRPDSVTFFDVRTPSAPYSDSTAIDKKTCYPVMVSSGAQGNYEPIPDIMYWHCSLSVTFIYPVSQTEIVRRYFDMLAKSLNGKMTNFGVISGKCVCAFGVPTIGQLQYLEENQFQSFKEETNKLFGITKNVSRAWSTMTVEIYLSGSDKSGDTDGLIFGNQVTDELSFTYASTLYKETLLPVSASGAKQSSTYEQQGLSSINQTSLETNTAYAKSFAVLVRANAFWGHLIDLAESGTLQGVEFSLVHKIQIGTTAPETYDTLFSKCTANVSFSHDLGKPMSCIISLTPKSTLGVL